VGYGEPWNAYGARIWLLDDNKLMEFYEKQRFFIQSFLWGPKALSPSHGVLAVIMTKKGASVRSYKVKGLKIRMN